MRNSLSPLGYDIFGLSQDPFRRKSPAYARDGRRQGLVPPRDSWCRSYQVLTCGNATGNFYPARRAGKASAGVPLLWPGTDVLLDPGDEHGGTVPLGTDGGDQAAIVMRRSLIDESY